MRVCKVGSIVLSDNPSILLIDRLKEFKDISIIFAHSRILTTIIKNSIYLFAYICSCVCFSSCSSLVAIKDHPIPPVEEKTCSPVSGIMACYSFSEGGKDNSGNNYTGQIVGAISTSDRFGNPNSAYSFTGSSYIELPSNTFKTMNLRT